MDGPPLVVCPEPGAEDSGAARGAIPKSGGGDGPAAERSARVPCQGGALVIGVWGALAGALVLLLVLLAWVRAEASSKDPRSDWGVSDQEQGESVEACSLEIVSQLFSAADAKFISGLESPGLENLFRRERTAVALHWVQETSAFISKVMRRHLEASRLRADLEIAVRSRFFFNSPGFNLFSEF